MTETNDMAEQPGPSISTSQLVRPVLLAWAATAAVVAGVLVLVDSLQWWQGLLAAAVISGLAAAASLPPLLWGLRGRLSRAVIGYFLAAGVRLLVSLGGCLLAILSGGYPPLQTLLLMVVFYFAVLAAESAILGRTIWPMKA